MPSFSIHSHNMILPDGMREATLVIEEGMIAAVKEGPADTEGPVSTDPAVFADGSGFLDAGHLIVMPGIIDPHVHINEPGRTDWEGFDTATRAAIAGGITTLVEMPLNASPVTTTVAAFDQKIAATHGQLHTNCGFWGGLVPGNEKDIEPLIDAGVLGFKAFLTHSGIDEFPNVTEADLREAMPIIARSGLPLLVHCELEGPLDPCRPAGGDPRSYHNYLSSRPPSWEDNAIALMIRLCEEFGCRTHIVHLSSAHSIALIKAAKDRGLPLTVETAQHYLYFVAEEIGDGLPAYKCAPPIRERENNDKLWQALHEGIIDLVATDHSPAPPDMKQLASGDLARAWGGISSIQLALPILWTAAKKRGVTPAQLAKWLCLAPARLAGESTRRGAITPGFIADLVVWDPGAGFRVDGKDLLHRHPLTPYQDRELLGLVHQTWLGGMKVFDRGVLSRPDQGRIILNGRHA